MLTLRFLLLCAAMTTAVALSGCSNGRGSVEEAAVGETPDPPPSQPPPSQPPPSEPPPDPEPPPPPEPEPPPTPEPPPPEPEPPPAEEPPQPPRSALAGFWRGAVNEEGDDDARAARALIDHFGNIHLMVGDSDSNAFVVFGNVCCAASADQELVGFRYLNTRDEDAQLAAQVSSSRLSGEFEFRKDDYSLDLTRDSAEARPLTLAELAGVYTRTTPQLIGPPSTMTITINDDGAFTGSHSNGCTLNGSAGIPNPSRSTIRLELRVDQCGGFGSSRNWNGEYTGLGVLLRDAPAPGNPGQREDTLLMSLVGETWFGVMTVGR